MLPTCPNRPYRREKLAYSLLLMAERAKEKGNVDLYNRLMEEACGEWTM